MTPKSYLLNGIYLLVGVLMTLVGIPAYSQQSFGGTPLAINTGTPLRMAELSHHLVSVGFNPADLEVQDAWTAPRDGHPLNVGRLVPYEVNFAENAVLVESQAGTQIYRLTIELEGNPLGIGLYYDDFYIPEGGRLYIYTSGGRQVLGAYTHETHPEHGSFATEPLAGSQLTLDYEAPQGVAMPSILISSVGYFYRSVFQIAYAQDGLGYFQGNEEKSDPGMKRFCQVNANCPEGDAYQNQKASSVAMLIIENGRLKGMCSGNLINNVKEDNTPFIISAAHCATSEKKFNVHNSDLDKWIFGFHYEKPRCSSGDYATTTLRSMVGARMKAFLPIDGYSDGLLLQLKQEIPVDYRVYYSGWDASNKDWQRGVGLHHPAGDALKVSTFDGGVSFGRWNGEKKGGDQDHLNFLFQKGNTEGGSSGSPLFNDAGLQIGTLSGGRGGICPMDASYGRFYSHFAKYANKGNTFNMKHWLDPNNTGKTKIEGRWNGSWQPLQVVKELTGSIVPNDPTKVTLAWTAVSAHPQGYKVSYKLYRNGKLLKTLDGTTYEDTIDESLTASGQIAYKVEACYDVDGTEEKTPAAFRIVYTGELASEVTAKVTPSGSSVSLSWSMPYNTQIVSKVNRDKLSLLKAPHNASSWNFGEFTIQNILMYDIFRLGRSPFAGQKLYIHQINFIPAVDTPLTSAGKPDYSRMMRFFARQRTYGSNTLKLASVVVPQGTAAKKSWMSIQLSSPIEIDDAYNLEAGFICSRGYSDGAVYIDLRSSDEYVGADGCRLGFEISGDPSHEFLPYGHFSENRGYQALELVVSNNPNKQSGVTNRAYTRGKLPVAFPEVKSYVIYRDGAKVHETSADTYSWTDPNGKSDSKYRIEVVYDYPNELRPIQSVEWVAPQLYPAHFAETLQLANPEAVLRVQLFNLQGVCVADFTGGQLAGMLDVSTLTQGAYVAVITTAEGSTTQKLMK